MQKGLSKNIVLLLLSTMLFFASFIMLSPTFSLYVKSMGGNEGIAGLLTGLLTLAAIFLRTYFAKLADEKGRKFVLYLAGIASITAPLLYMVDLGFWFVALVRVYHSISVAAYVATSQTLLADLASPETRGSTVALYGVAAGTSSAIAPYVAFSIIESKGFPTLFMLSAGIAVLMTLVIALIKEPPVVVRDKKAPSTSLKEIVSDAWILVPSITIFSLMFAQGAVNAFLPLHGAKVGLENVGIFFSLSAVLSIIYRLGTGYLSDKIGGRRILMPALALTVVGILSLIGLPRYAMLIMAAVLTSFGFSAAHTVLLTIIVDKTQVQKRAQAVTFFTNAWDLGTSLGAMGLGALALYSYSALWSTVALGVLAGFIVTVRFLPRSTAGNV